MSSWVIRRLFLSFPLPVLFPYLFRAFPTSPRRLLYPTSVSFLPLVPVVCCVVPSPTPPSVVLSDPSPLFFPRLPRLPSFHSLVLSPSELTSSAYRERRSHFRRL
ncbi:hypothetical protein FA13DRAFT_1475777 [Coprinellus micaceus]|uniref:Uncharacterized protein n=1 Tax=Coprinellus micaceus TaxID=71717 RepID=A0A4Y7SLV4_COPMI|nr:hypothetical protein FA13DRAFT_1475777 [Coprinellus micaceus]